MKAARACRALVGAVLLLLSPAARGYTEVRVDRFGDSAERLAEV